MDKPEFVYVTYIATTPEKLWEALTGSEFIRQYWFGREVESDWRVGSPVVYRYDEGRKLDFTGEVLRSEPPSLLSFTFDPHTGDGPRQERPSRVTYEIEPMGSAVKLRVTHDDLEPGSKVLAGVSNGWPAILSGLKSLLETGTAIVFKEKDFREPKEESRVA
jgi:uncharacterized protein YndB with AHSA1/START domain